MNHPFQKERHMKLDNLSKGSWGIVPNKRAKTTSCKLLCKLYIIYIYTFIVIVLCIKTSKHATNMWSQRWQGTHPFSSFELHFQPQSLDFFVEVPLNRIEKGRHKSAYIPKRTWNHWKTTGGKFRLPRGKWFCLCIMYAICLRNLQFCLGTASCDTTVSAHVLNGFGTRFVFYSTNDGFNCVFRPTTT